jgi:hypothetical protein
MTMEWISVKDRLPEPGQLLWVAKTRTALTSVSGRDPDGYTVVEAVYYPSRKFPYSGDGPSVHFWMPRESPPAPPERKTL